MQTEKIPVRVTQSGQIMEPKGVSFGLFFRIFGPRGQMGSDTFFKPQLAWQMGKWGRHLFSRLSPWNPRGSDRYDRGTL